MKKTLYILSAVLMFMASSCAKDSVPVVSEGIKMVKATIKATSTDSQSKTTATWNAEESKYNIFWEVGDELSVFNSLNTTMSKFTAAEGGESTEFTGEIPEGSDVTYAILPYNTKASVSGTTVFTNLPKEQNGDFSNIILAGWPKARTKAESTYDFNYQFEAVTGIIKFHFDPTRVKKPNGDPLLAEGEKITSVSIVADRPISGDAQISYAGEKPVMTASSKNTSNTVNLITPDGLAEGDYYFATFPILTSDIPTLGIAVVFETNKGNMAHVKATLPGAGKEHIFTANIVKNIGNVKITEFDNYPFSSGEFTIDNAGNKVSFSRGNLQYRASDKIWRFALNQWDVQGNVGNSTLPAVNEFGNYDNEGPRATQSDWIDLFPWGHTGWNDGKRTYEPSLCTAVLADFYGQYYTNGLNGTNGDWGYYNEIRNGDKVDPAGIWRVPSLSELVYILDKRTKNIKLIEYWYSEWSHSDRYLRFLKCGIREIGGEIHYGLLIFPDGFEWPSDLDYPLRSDGTTLAFSERYLSYDEAPKYDLSLFASKFTGCVFLPCAGYRTAFEQYNPDCLNPRGREHTPYWADGRYWTNNHPSGFQFAMYTDNISFDGEMSSIWWGRSVRLVKDVVPAPAE